MWDYFRVFWYFVGNVIEEEERGKGCIFDMVQINYVEIFEDNFQELLELSGVFLWRRERSWGYFIERMERL